MTHAPTGPTGQRKPNPLRVLMVTGAYPTEKIPHWGTFIKSQVDSLCAEGVRVEVIHPPPGPTLLRYVRAAIQVMHRVLTGRCDLVHGHYGLWCLVARLQWRVPVVASFLGDDLLGTPREDGTFTPKSRLVIRVSRWLAAHVDAVIVKSAEMAQRVPAANPAIIPNGVDMEFFHPIPRRSARSTLGWDPARHYVLFGNDPAIPRKGFPLAREAVDRLQARGVPAELVVANGLPQSTLRLYINASDVLLLPSILEGSPNIVKEAMACNVPVVATAVGDVQELIGRTKGCAVCSRDPDELAAALENAIRHAGPTTGRQDIQHLERSAVARRVLAVYEHVLARKAGTRAHADAPRGRVLMVVENMPVPADVRVWAEALALQADGYQVAIISPKGAQDHRAAYECIAGIHIFRYDLPAGESPTGYVVEYGLALLRTAALSIKIWRRYRFEIVHVANPPDLFFLLGLLFRPFGVRLIFDQHDLSPEVFAARFTGGLTGLPARIMHRLLGILEWCSYRASDRVIVANETFRRLAIERGGVRPEKITVVRNGPDLRRLHPVEPRSNLKKGRPHLLGYVGTMAPQDGTEYAIKALDLLVHQRGRQDISLLLVGDGASFTALRELTRTLRLEDYVTFTGRVPPQDVAPYLSAIDIGLSPEPRDDLNNASTLIKVMEYMTLAKPVVAFDLAETRFSLQDAGLYAQPNSVEDFADRIEQLLDDPDLRCRLGKQGRQRIEDELSWEHSRKQLLRAYAALPAPRQQKG